jgi:putative endonuclease
VREFYVYILSSHSRRFYVGVTNNLERRLYEHVRGCSNFTSKYNINRLVYFETLPHPMSAICREKAVKRMSRRQKIALIESQNPYWIDLAAGWFDPPKQSPSPSDNRPSRREAAGG